MEAAPRYSLLRPTVRTHPMPEGLVRRATV
jgi:hypothetical protein